MTATEIPPAATAELSARPVAAGVERRASASLRAWWAVLLVLGALQAWSARHYVNPDGVSYLDIAGYFASGRWGDAISGYWSPLLPWLLAQAMRLVRPSLYFEATLAHAVLFATYVLSAASFELLRRELQRTSPWLGTPIGIALSYAMFVWSGISMIGLEKLTPDSLVAAAMFTGAALLVRAERGGGAWTYSALGAVLGVGYWAKAAVFPAAFAFFAAAALAAMRARRREHGLDRAHARRAHALSRALLAPVVFAVVAGPLVATLSLRKGRPSIGDVGRLAYGWFVDGYPQFWWTGEPAGSGTPVHPPRQVLADPPVFEFGGEVNGTYPLWFDPPHWYEGLAVKPAPVRLLRRFLIGLRDYVALFGVLVPLSLLPALIAGGGRGVVRAVARAAVLVVPAVAVLGLYSLVLVEGRYVSAPAVILCLALLAASAPSGRPPERSDAMLAVAGAMILVAGLTLVPVIPSTARALQSQIREGRGAHLQWTIARRLAAAGVRPGDPVGSIGLVMQSYWPRLAGVHIVAEAPVVPRTGEELDRVTAALLRTGVRAVVLEPAYRPPDRAVSVDGWSQLGETGYSVRKP